MFSSQTGRKLAGGYVAEGLQSFLEGLGGLSVQHNAHAVVVSMRDDTFEVWTTTLPQALTFPQALDPGRWVEKLEVSYCIRVVRHVRSPLSRIVPQECDMEVQCEKASVLT